MQEYFSGSGLYCELIETLWNVNITLDLFSNCGASELIETLWNVNEKIIIVSRVIVKELIETLWNVNTDTPLNCRFSPAN